MPSVGDNQSVPDLGVPADGMINQTLVKNSSSPLDASWNSRSAEPLYASNCWYDNRIGGNQSVTVFTTSYTGPVTLYVPYWSSYTVAVQALAVYGWSTSAVGWTITVGFHNGLNTGNGQPGSLLGSGSAVVTNTSASWISMPITTGLTNLAAGWGYLMVSIPSGAAMNMAYAQYCYCNYNGNHPNGSDTYTGYYMASSPSVSSPTVSPIYSNGIGQPQLPPVVAFQVA